MEEYLTKKYPVDVSNLNKGDYIEPEMISKTFEIEMDDPHFRLYQLKLSSYIEIESARQGRALLPKQEGNGIRILTDEEASRYRPIVADNHARALRRELSRMMRIDISNLSYESKNRLETEVMRNSKRVIALKGVNKEILALPSATRSTPSMLSGETKEDDK